MAFANKYLIEFSSIFAHAWKIETQEDAFAESVTDLIATGEPLSIEYDSGDDSYNFPIRPSKAVFRVHSLTDFQLTDFYSEQDFRLKVKISLGANLFWQGFVSTGEYSEPYECVPYPVQITAVDGLNYLKELPFVDSISVTAGVETITYYEGRQFESLVICNILAKAQITEFKEFLNIYETRMNATADDSPLDQCKIDVDVFKGKSCYDALTEILKHYSAVIRQNTSGEMCIYRPKELTGTTVYGRKFTAWNTKTSVSISPSQFIDRIGVASNLKQIPGGALITKRAAKKVTLNLDYGYKDSWIENGEFKADTFNIATYKFANWTYYGGTGHVSLANMIPGETDGLGLIHGSGSPPAYNVSQSFGAFAVSTTDIMVIEFEYLLYNPMSSDDNATFYVMVKSDNGSNYLSIADGLTASWGSTPAYLTLTGLVKPGKRDWELFKRKIIGLPVYGPYTIYFHVLSSTYCYAGFKNVKFYSTSDEIVNIKYPWYKVAKWKKKIFSLFVSNLPKGDTFPVHHDLQEVVAKQYVIDNAVDGIHLIEDYVLCDVTDTNIDNVIEQFKGALAISVSSLSVSAETFVIDHAADYVAGGVIVTRAGSVIYFTSAIVGVNFTGSTTISNTSGDLSGTPATVQSNVTGTKQKDRMLLSGTGGEGAAADITCNGLTLGMVYGTSLELTASGFVSGAAGDWAEVNVTLTYEVDGGNVYLYFEEIATVGGFTGSTTIVNTTPDLGGTVTTIQEAAAGQARIDTITLSGSSGTANILCDGVTAEVAASVIIAHTEAWNTRGGSENDPIHEIIGAEMALQHSRPKQLIQMNILDTEAEFNLIGNVRDILDSIYGRGVNLISSWVNVDYDTFTSSGLSITAVETGSSGDAKSNEFVITDGEIMTLIVNVTLNSGALPSAIIKDLALNNITNGVSLVAGLNIVDLTLTTTGSGAGNLWLINSSATNYETSEAVLVRKPRKFISNRAELDCKNAIWNTDLIEILD